MAKMKVFELKNLINEKTHKDIESKDIQSYLDKNMGIKKTHSSNLEDHEIKAVKEHFIPSAKKTSEAPTAKNVRSASPREEKGTVQSSSQSRPQGSSQSRPQGQPQRSQRPDERGSQYQARPQGQSQSRPHGQRPDERGSQYNQGRPQDQSQRNQRPSQGGTKYGQGKQQGMNRQQTSPQQQDDKEQRTTEQGESNQGTSSYQGNRYNQDQRQGQRPDQRQGQGQSTYAQRQGQGQQGQSSHSQRQGQGQQGQSSYSQRQGQGQQGQSSYSQRQGQGQGSYAQRQGQQGQSSYAQRQGQQGQSSYAQRQGQQGQGSYAQRQGQQGQGSYAQRQGQQGQGSYAQRQGQGQGSYAQRQGQQGQGSYAQRQGQQGQGSYAQRQGQQGQGSNAQRQGQQGQGSYAQRQGQQGQGSYAQRQGQGQGSYAQRQGQQGQQGQGQQGQRPSGNRTGGYNSNTYRKPAGSQGGGQRGGYNNYNTFKKDEDDKPAYNSRSQGNRKTAGSSDRKNFDQQILNQKMAEKNDFSNKRNRDRLSKDKSYRDKGSAKREAETDIAKLAPKKGQFIKPEPIVKVVEEIKVISLPEILTIKELADKMRIPSSALIKKLFLAGQVVTINYELTYDEAEEIALGYDIISEKEIVVNEVEELLKEDEEDPTVLVKRPPVICVMGHVDHGKTSLLDAIRHADVTSREAGGITQHIGAYMVEIKGEKITFLDTPGHEAFTSMRMRGAQATDIAILVVAADDGVMPQTIEAISHAKAAGVKIIVAINKIDKPSANIERVKQELTEYELVAEDWGGDTIFVPVSAHTQEGIEQLLEMILLTAEVEELKANPDRMGRGLVIEAELDKGRGSVATILVQKGTLRVGDNIAVGSSCGKVRAMINDKGNRVEEAGPSTPVEILGLNSVPDVGEIFMATENEKEARNIAEAFITQGKERLIADTKAKLSLDGLFTQIQAGNIKELNLIIKADVQGSVEAMKQSLLKLSNDEVAVRIIHGGVGAINESDIILATTSNGIIIGFNVKPDNMAKDRAEYENVDVKLYHVIYDVINDVEAAMKGLLDPVFEEKITGHAEVRQIFKASVIGNIAGSYVLDGKVVRGSKARIYRGSELVYDGILSSLKRFQDDVKEVAAGYECGLVFDKFNEIKEEDKVEFYVMVEVPR